MKINKSFFLLLFLCLPAFALADGWHLSDYSTHMNEPWQKAFIYGDSISETMIIASAIQANDIQKFGWVIPVRSNVKPEVTESSSDLFGVLVRYFGGSNIRSGRMAADKGDGHGVEVVETLELGVYDVTLLKADDPGALVNWLDTNGYKVTPAAKDVLVNYTQFHDCWFVANRIDMRNKYKEQIDTLEAAYANLIERYKKSCTAVNSAFADIGIRGRIDPEAAEFFNYRPADRVAVEEYVNSPENPLGLPSLYVKDLGNGLTLEERFRAKFSGSTVYREQDWKGTTFGMDKHEKRVITVKKNGTPVTLVDFEAGYWRPGDSTDEGYQMREFVFTSPEALSDAEKESVKKSLFFDYPYISKTSGQIPFPDEARMVEKLASFWSNLSSRAGDRMKECELLNRSLFQQADYERKYRNLQPGETPLLIKMTAVMSAAGTSFKEGPDMQYYYPLQKALSDLARGTSTPLKIRTYKNWLTYPLVISSLNPGKSVIEVYVAGPRPMKDTSGTMKVDKSKQVDDGMAAYLTQYCGLTGVKYLTRFVYSGELSGLKRDAYFVPQ